MEEYLRNYTEDFFDDLLYFFCRPSYKNLVKVLKYFEFSHLKRYKVESMYWKDKDITKTHADDF